MSGDPFQVGTGLSNVSRQRDERKRVALAQRQHDADLKDVLATPAGKRFVRRLLGEFRIYESSMTGNAQTYFNEGVRECGLWLMREIGRVSPGDLSLAVMPPRPRAPDEAQEEETDA